MEKFLEIEKLCSIVKTFFVIEGYKTTTLLLPMLLYFYCRQNLIK
jgi:hypothetical protein